MNKSISVIVPCFREEKTILKNLKYIDEYLKRNFSQYEIIAVSDGSPDGTLGELKKAEREFNVKVIANSINEGKGKVVKDGVLASQNEVIMFLDADLAIPIESVEKFMETIDNGYDLAIASRFVPGLNVIKPVLWYRRIMEKVFRWLRMIIINNYEIQDTQCGFKMFSRRAAMDIFPRMTIKRFAFDAEIIFIATKEKYKIKELPITLQNPVRSSIRIFRDSWNMFNDLLKIRRNNLLGKYKVKK